MISFVVWKWGVKFKAEYVNILRASVARHYPKPHRFICVTDEPQGLANTIEVLPQPVTFDGVKNLQGDRFPSCYRRLWNFSHAARAAFGDRILSIDIDAIITGDLRPVIDRPGNFIGWTDPKHLWNKVAGGIYLLQTGTYPHVWEEFDPAKSPLIAYKNNCLGSDQGWMSYKLYPPEQTWTRRDGVYSIKWLNKHTGFISPQVRVVSTPGKLKPWDKELQELYPWVKKHWRI